MDYPFIKLLVKESLVKSKGRMTVTNAGSVSHCKNDATEPITGELLLKRYSSNTFY